MNPVTSTLQRANQTGRRLISWWPVRILSRGAYPLLGALSVRRPFLKRLEVDGMSMYVSRLDLSVGLSLLQGNHWEKLTSDLLTQRLQRGMRVIDLGAQVGYYTLMASKLVGPGGQVFAFEPDPRHVKLLRKNVESNGLDNVEVAPKAVSDATGSASLAYDSWSGQHRVDTVKLDDFFAPGRRKMDFIKMDIDGGEIPALSGMEGIVRESPGLQLLVEYDPWQQIRSGRTPAQLLERLQGLGFQLRWIINEAQQRAIPTHEWKELDGVKESVNLWLVLP